MDRPAVAMRATLLLLTFGISIPPAWAQRTSSQDRIAFTRVREDVRVPGDYQVEAEIWMMDADGRNARRLTTNTSDDFGIAWSPDGKTVVFGAVQFERDSAGEFKPKTAQLYTM